MKINVLMLAFGEPGEVREVVIPDNTPADEVLDVVFRLGQNDFQPQPHPSVSVGDVIEHNGHQLIKPLGFTCLTDEQLTEYKALPRRERSFSQYLELS